MTVDFDTDLFYNSEWKGSHLPNSHLSRNLQQVLQDHPIPFPCPYTTCGIPTSSKNTLHTSAPTANHISTPWGVGGTQPRTAVRHVQSQARQDSQSPFWYPPRGRSWCLRSWHFSKYSTFAITSTTTTYLCIPVSWKARQQALSMHKATPHCLQPVQTC